MATFDVTDPPVAYWQAKLDSMATGDHVLVGCDVDVVIGYACSG